ncbi:Asp-tRNA(Asn)/Glu-tRNA(Gln) amidotransferase subunit GatC [Deltaproteobacteria bacterium TL4]
MFTEKDVNKIAELSQLKLTGQEKAVFPKQFSSILAYFEILNSAAVPTASGDRDESQMQIARKDQTQKSPVTPKSFSPYLEETYFKVPKVIEQAS